MLLLLQTSINYAAALIAKGDTEGAVSAYARALQLNPVCLFSLILFLKHTEKLIITEYFSRLGSVWCEKRSRKFIESSWLYR